MTILYFSNNIIINNFKKQLGYHREEIKKTQPRDLKSLQVRGPGDSFLLPAQEQRARARQSPGCNQEGSERIQGENCHSLRETRVS